MIERPDPGALLAGPLGEWLASQQALRDRTRRTVGRLRTGSVVVGGVLAVLTLIITRDLEPSLGIAGVCLTVGFFLAAAIAKPVTDSIKSQINGAVAQALDLDYALTCDGGDAWERVKSFFTLPGYDKESFEDRWSGQLGALPFHAFEAHCQEWRGSGKNRRLETVLRGSVLTVAFTRSFQGATLVEGDRERTGWLGGEKEEIDIDGLILQRCDMVDPTFEDRFTVWGNDAVEARFLVHPEYIERLVAVERAFGGSNLRALFWGGELLILVETENQFESGSLEASDDEKLLVQTIEQFGALADLAHHLNEAPRGNYPSAASA